MNASATAEQATPYADRQQLNQSVYDALIEMAQRDSPARARRAAFDIIGPSRSSSSHVPLVSGSRRPSCGSSPRRAMLTRRCTYSTRTFVRSPAANAASTR